MKGEQDMERQTPKNENTEFKDLPDVKIDPEKEVPSQKHFSKKTGIIIILFNALQFVHCHSDLLLSGV